jgi:hypothetical protein
MKILNSIRTTIAYIIVVFTTLFTCHSQEQFTTVKKSFTFVVIGDWGRNGNEDQMKLVPSFANIVEKSDAEFIVSTGDNFYPVGVQSVDDIQWMNSFEIPYKAHPLHIPWYTVVGNHDYRGNVQAQIDYMKRSRRWNFPSRYYTKKHLLEDATPKTEVQLFYIDTNPFIEDYQAHNEEYNVKGQDTKKQLQWLENELKKSTAKWKFVVGHHHIYSGGKRKGEQKELVQHIVPLLKKYNVTAYLNGHEHDLQHIQRDGMHFITSGAGSEIRPTGNVEGTKFAKSMHGFVTVSLTNSEALLQFVDEKEMVQYKLILK